MADLNRDEMVALGFVDISGTWYKKVSARVKDFREKHPDYTISTEIKFTEKTCRAVTEIKDPNGRLISNGHSEKKWAQGSASRAVGVERVETASVGRALAFFGMGGDDIGSADEIVDSIEDRTGKLERALENVLKHIAVIDRNWSSVIEIRQAIDEEQWDRLREVYDELSDDDKIDLDLAPSKGGLLSTYERKQLKDGDGIREARKLHREGLKHG